MGTDEAREAKIEETLRKMGIKGAKDIAKENEKSVGEKITSIFDVGLPRCCCCVSGVCRRVRFHALLFIASVIRGTLCGMAWVSHAWRRILPMPSVWMQYR